MAHTLKHGERHMTDAGAEVRQQVAGLLAELREEGEAAVRRLSATFDAWNPMSFRIDPDHAELAASTLDGELRAHLGRAAERIRRFAELQRNCLLPLEIEMEPGFVAGHRHVPVGSVGAYVPGGRYQLVASALMSIIPAKVAGVPRVIAMLGPRHAIGPSAATVYAAHLAGADEIWCLGGVQALGALAYGLLPGLPAVDMIVGAGNRYVAEAKRQLYGTVGVDLLAGPSEVLIIADESAEPERIAIDLLAQAEHGPDSPAVLITQDRPLAEAVLRAVATATRDWSTRDIADAAWQRYGQVIVADSVQEAVLLSDRFAPEHVQLMVRDASPYLEALKNYGGIFIGMSSAVAMGDKAAGPNHTLPTQGGARYAGGLSVHTYLKTLTFQRFTTEGAREIAADAAAISLAEGMVGHAGSARLRTAPGAGAAVGESSTGERGSAWVLP
jgi:sulfopropanediol 3-dehydrogenase